MLNVGRFLSDTVSRCGTDGKMRLEIKAVLNDLGIENYIFYTLMKDQKERTLDRITWGCDPIVASFHGEHDVIADPFITYGRQKSKPILISDLKEKISDQVFDLTLFDVMSRNGFKSGMVIPAHTTSNARIGVLVVGVSVDDNDIFKSCEVFLRGIAGVILEWWIDSFTIKNRNISRLIDEDFVIMKYSLRDYRAKEISAITGWAESRIYNRSRVINEIFETSSTKQAAEMAMQAGLISPV